MYVKCTVKESALYGFKCLGGFCMSLDSIAWLLSQMPVSFLQFSTVFDRKLLMLSIGF